MIWIYLSPHLDDAILSCGARIWQQVQSGDRVEIWTVCTADSPTYHLPPFAQMLHARWNTGEDASAVRRAEDQAACAQVGAAYRHLGYPDCIYRFLPDGSPLVQAEADLFTAPFPRESALIADLAQLLLREIPKDAQVVCPLTLGSHTDHQLTRKAVEQAGLGKWYYADFPYAARLTEIPVELLPDHWKKEEISLTEEAMAVWEAAILDYKSQISTFWGTSVDLRTALKQHAERGWAGLLWQAG